MRFSRIFFVCGSLMLAASFTGCAVHQPLEIGLVPEYSSNLLHVDETKLLSLTVVDERPVKEIGQRGVDIGGEINVKGDVPTLIKVAIQKNLEEGNFKVENYAAENITDLTIEVRHLNYKIVKGVWSGAAKAESAMKAICTPIKGKAYKKLYTGEYEVNGLQLVPGEDEIPKIVAKAVGNNLDNMANDEKLVNCISGK